MIDSIKRRVKILIIKIVNRGKNIKINNKSNISNDCYFEGNNVINDNCIINNTKVGFGTYFGRNCYIAKTRIGRFCSIANNVSIVIGTHPTKDFVSTHPAFFSTQKQAGFTFVNHNKFDEMIYRDKKNNISVEIGNDVWIGENVIILGNVKIGDGAIIGAGSIVTKDIEPYSINVGVPSKIIKYRFSKEDIEYLKKIKWWNKDYKWIEENAHLFDNIEKLKEVIKCQN